MAATGLPVGDRAAPQRERAPGRLAGDLREPGERDVTSNDEPKRGITGHALYRVARDDLGDEGGGLGE